MNKPITQKDKFGCGVASVAFVLEITYQEALEMFDKNDIEKPEFYCRDLVRALENANCKYNYKYLKPGLQKKIYKKGVIVFIKKSKDYPYGHYLARTDNCWMDSWINLRKDKDIKNAKSSSRRRLPGRPIYAIFPEKA